MIYLAHPYTTGNTNLSLEKILKKVGQFAYSVHLIKQCIYYPVLMGESILRWSGIENKEENQKADFWWWHDKWMIERSSELWIFGLPGWDTSENVIKEVNHAAGNLGLSTSLVTEEDSQYTITRIFFKDLVESKLNYEDIRKEDLVTVIKKVTV